MSALLHGITSKHKGDCLNCPHSFRTENKNEEFCGIVMPPERIIY